MVKKTFGKSKKSSVSIKFFSSLKNIIDSGRSSNMCPKRYPEGGYWCNRLIWPIFSISDKFKKLVGVVWLYWIIKKIKISP